MNFNSYEKAGSKYQGQILQDLGELPVNALEMSCVDRVQSLTELLYCSPKRDLMTSKTLPLEQNYSLFKDLVFYQSIWHY